MSDVMGPNDAMDDDRDETGNEMIDLDPRLAAALRDVGPIDPAVRAAAVNAALATVSTGEVTSLDAERRRRRVRVMSSLSAAAAAIVLVAVGISVAPSGGGDDAADMSSAAVTENLVEGPAGRVPAATESARNEEPAAEPAMEAPAMEESMAAEADIEDTAVTAYEVDDGLPVLMNKAELVDQTDAFAAMLAEGSAKTPESECLMIGGGAVGRAIYDSVEVVLFRDLASGTYTALATDDCRTIVQVIVEP